MNEQPTALRLADVLDRDPSDITGHKAAAELRRLHAEVQEQCRLNGMGSEREARLMAENEALRAALAEPVEPVAYSVGRTLHWHEGRGISDVQLYTSPPQRPAEPVQEPYTNDVTRIIREAGMTFHLGLPHKPVIEQMSRVVDLVYAEASIKAAQQFVAPPQRPAEQDIEPVAWQWLDTGTFRKKLPKTAERCAWNPLYAAPPQRKPLTEEEVNDLMDQIPREDVDSWSFRQGVCAAEAAHGIGSKT
jgi:hypothetical protein